MSIVDTALARRPSAIGLPAMCGAPGFALPVLIGNGDVVRGLPSCRNAQIKRDPQSLAVACNGHGFDRSMGSIEPKSSSRTSPKYRSNISISASVIGTFSGQSSMTVQVDTSCFGRRRFGLETAWLGFVDETDRDLCEGFDIHSVSLEWQRMETHRGR